MSSPSWQARAISLALRLTFKRQLAAAQGVDQVRQLMGRNMSRTPREMEIAPWPHAGGGQGERLRCLRTPPRARLMYVHGGGFVAGSPHSHRSITVALARLGFEVWVPDYRLAPEHPFPQGLEQLLALYGEASYGLSADQHMLLAGDSAGGGLVLSLMLMLKEGGRALPTAAALLSPLLDLTLSGHSIDANARLCAMFSRGPLERAVELYLGGQDARLPLASPVRADLQGLPPLIIHVGQNETLLDDAVALSQACQRDGVEAQLRIWPAVPHVWQLFGRYIPEARQSLREVAAFLHQHNLTSSV
jgi:acetyl esterase/lipase